MAEPITREQMARWLDERTELISIHGNSAHERRIIQALRSLLTDRRDAPGEGDFASELRDKQFIDRFSEGDVVCPFCHDLAKRLQKQRGAETAKPSVTREDAPGEGGDFPQEETLQQIRRMIDHLPETNECPENAGGCLRLSDLMISKWARGFLKQMIRDVERRGT